MAEEGPRALFKGGPARVLRSSPQFGVSRIAFLVSHSILTLRLLLLGRTSQLSSIRRRGAVTDSALSHRLSSPTKISNFISPTPTARPPSPHSSRKAKKRSRVFELGMLSKVSHFFEISRSETHLVDVFSTPGCAFGLWRQEIEEIRYTWEHAMGLFFPEFRSRLPFVSSRLFSAQAGFWRTSSSRATESRRREMRCTFDENCNKIATILHP